MTQFFPAKTVLCHSLPHSNEADTRLKSDNKGQEKYDCCILVLVTMQVLAIDVPIDSLEELTGISSEKRDFLSLICLVDDFETEQMDIVS